MQILPVLNYSNTDINCSYAGCLSLNESVTANIISGSISSDTSYAIYLYSNTAYPNTYPTLNIGTPGGAPSTTDPVIQGKNYAIYKSNPYPRIYFYDGVIKGETAPVSGSITDYEPGYKEDRKTVTDPDTGITTIESTLTIIGDDIRTVVVNNVNFTSIQSAVNYAVNNNINRIDLYNDIELSDDLVKPDGINVNIYLNGFTITTGSYTISDGITIVDGNTDPNNGLGASILNYNEHT